MARQQLEYYRHPIQKSTSGRLPHRCTGC
jgi:hypothetical protein